jgi:hypothetical protein
MHTLVWNFLQDIREKCWVLIELTSFPSFSFSSFPNLLLKNTLKLSCKFLSLSIQGDPTFRVPAVASIGAFLALCQCLWKGSAPGWSRGDVVFFSSQPQGMTLSSLVKGGTRLVPCASGTFQCFPHCIDSFFNKHFCLSFLALLFELRVSHLLGPLPLQWL